MLLAVLLVYLTVAFANPFHKYPFVFLLDVGNEELEKVNSEQIRISKQGGSLALRYPAVGNGDDIGHVRVSGIDFGTDLKANIVDGGPGYKYVVIVLMGNPGMAYDAVITIQTVPGDSVQNTDKVSTDVAYQESDEDDPNDSAEDLGDRNFNSNIQLKSEKKNAEIVQESSNVYNYVPNEKLSGYEDGYHSNDDDTGEENDDENESSNENEKGNEPDIHVPKESDFNQYETIEAEDYSSNEEGPGKYSVYVKSPQVAKYTANEVSAESEQQYADDHNEYLEDSQLQQHRSLNVIGSGYNNQGYPVDDPGTVFVEEPEENDEGTLDDLFGEDYDQTDGRIYDNNNFIDRSDEAAVAY